MMRRATGRSGRSGAEGPPILARDEPERGLDLEHDDSVEPRVGQETQLTGQELAHVETQILFTREQVRRMEDLKQSAPMLSARRPSSAQEDARRMLRDLGDADGLREQAQHGLPERHRFQLEHPQPPTTRTWSRLERRPIGSGRWADSYEK